MRLNGFIRCRNGDAQCRRHEGTKSWAPLVVERNDSESVAHGFEQLRPETNPVRLVNRNTSCCFVGALDLIPWYTAFPYLLCRSASNPKSSESSHVNIERPLGRPPGWSSGKGNLKFCQRTCRDESLMALRSKQPALPIRCSSGCHL